MPAAFDRCSMFLNPCDENNRPLDFAQLIKQLQDIHLIGNRIKQDEDRFFTGERYLDYITYLGCAPNIQFEASADDDKFCAIEIHHLNKKRLIVSNTQMKPPLCPKCKQAVKNWQDTIDDMTLTCDRCQTTSEIEEYDWRKSGGYAKLFIEITDIFPKEAIPQPSLLQQLSKITDSDWRYFYSCR